MSVPVPHLGEDWIHADGMIDVFGGVLHETIVILLHSFLRGTFAILSWGRLGVFNIKKGCTEACKARQCCFGTKAENCVEMYPPQYCKGCSEVCLILKLDTEATTAAPEEVVVDPDSVMEATKTVAFDEMANVSPADMYSEEESRNKQTQTMSAPTRRI